MDGWGPPERIVGKSGRELRGAFKGVLAHSRAVNLKRKLESWREAGLLTAEQATGIQRYEDEHSGGGVQWVVWGIAAVGAVAVAAGVISLVAANWDEIPDSVKLGACLALLLGTLAGAWGAGRLASTWPRDLLLLVHDGMLLATVGLVAQVYHLSGHPWRAFALCAVLSLPAVLIAAHGLLVDFVLACVTVALGSYLGEIDWLDAALEVHFGAGFLFATVGLGLLLLAPLAARWRPVAVAPLERWGFGLALLTTAVSATLWSGHFWRTGTGMYLWPTLLALLCGLAAAAMAARELRRDESARGARVAAPILFFVFLVGQVVSQSPDASIGRKLVGFALFCALGVAVAMSMASAGSRSGTTLTTLALAVRVIALYIELVKDLMSTGLGLIVTGLVFVGVAYAWWRLNRALPIARPPATPGATP